MPYDLDTNVLSWKYDYRERHKFNLEIIEGALNRFEAALGLGSSSQMDVPLGLEEIFDRKGIIGRDSYDFTEGTKTGPNYYLNVALGAFWNEATFRYKLVSTNISLAALATGTYYVNVDAAGEPSVSASPNAESTTRQFHWDLDTKIVSAKALYTGVSILFDGDDYADMLTSTVRSKDFTRVADRLEEIESLIDPFGGHYALNLPHDGLNFKYKGPLSGGDSRVRNDSDFYITPQGQVALTDDSTNYIEVDPATGTVSANTTGFTSGKIGLWKAVTASGAITDATDYRTPAIAGTGGGGGGHTQGTDVGTTSQDWTIDTDAAGSPTGKVRVIFENGDDPNTMIAWDRDSGKFVLSKDGGLTWEDLASVTDLLGDLEFSKLVALENPQQVYYVTGRDSSEDWEELDLSGYITEAPNGVAGACLVIFFWDDVPSGSTAIKFRKGGSVAEPDYGYTVWSDVLQPHLRIIPVDTNNKVEYWVNASGTGTANVRVMLVGYYARVVGVGPANRVFTKADISVGAGATVQNNYTNWLNDGEVYYFKIDETGESMTGTYDVTIYAKDNFLEGTDQEDLIYKAEGIQPTSAFIDRLPFWIWDGDNTKELHIEIKNNDTENAGIFTFTIKAKQFA